MASASVISPQSHPPRTRVYKRINQETRLKEKLFDLYNSDAFPWAEAGDQQMDMHGQEFHGHYPSEDVNMNDPQYGHEHEETPVGLPIHQESDGIFVPTIAQPVQVYDQTGMDQGPIGIPVNRESDGMMIPVLGQPICRLGPSDISYHDQHMAGNAQYHHPLPLQSNPSFGNYQTDIVQSGFNNSGAFANPSDSLPPGFLASQDPHFVQPHGHDYPVMVNSVPMSNEQTVPMPMSGSSGMYPYSLDSPSFGYMPVRTVHRHYRPIKPCRNELFDDLYHLPPDPMMHMNRMEDHMFPETDIPPLPLMPPVDGYQVQRKDDNAFPETDIPPLPLLPAEPQVQPVSTPGRRDVLPGLDSADSVPVHPLPAAEIAVPVVSSTEDKDGERKHKHKKHRHRHHSSSREGSKTSSHHEKKKKKHRKEKKAKEDKEKVKEKEKEERKKIKEDKEDRAKDSPKEKEKVKRTESPESPKTRTGGDSPARDDNSTRQRSQSHLREQNEDEDLAVSNVDAKQPSKSVAPRKREIKIKRKSPQPSKLDPPVGMASQFATPAQLDHELRMRQRHLKLKEFLERKTVIHKNKLEARKRREQEKQLPKLSWDRRAIKIDGHMKNMDKEHDPSIQLMFDGKSYEQYYRDKYFEEVLGMNCPPEFMADNPYPVVVKPSCMFRAPAITIHRAARSDLRMNTSGVGDPLGVISIQEPTVIRYNSNSLSQSYGDNQTMNRYRYFNQDKRGVNYVFNKTKPGGLFENSPKGTLKLPPITRSKDFSAHH